MGRRAAICLLVLAALGWSSSVAAADDTSVEVSLDRTQVSPGDRLRYTVEASIRGSDSISIERKPSLGSALRVVGQRRSPRFVVRNGRARRALTVQYRLRAVETGEHTIRPPVVRIGSRKVKPDSRTVTITDNGGNDRGQRNERKPNDPNGRSRRRDDLFLAGVIRPTETPYVGQQLTLRYYLYKTPHQFDIEPRPPEEPSLDDFWIEGLSEEFAGQKRIVNVEGETMERTTMRVYALFPLKTGESTIEPMRVEVASGGFFSNQRKLELESEPIPLDVRPLPDGAPDAFVSGHVGDWHLSSDLDRRTSAVGDAVTLTLEVSGYGNPRRLTLPEPSESDAFMVASREEETSKELKGGRIWGRKRIEYTLTPTRQGTIEMPKLAFAYFDPDEESYETEYTQSFDVTVEKGTLSERQKAQLQKEAEGADDGETDEETSDDPVERLEGRLQGPLETVSATPPALLPLSLRPTLYWGLVGLLAAGVLGLLALPGLRRRWPSWRSRDSQANGKRRAESHLERARDVGADDAPEQVLQALKTYLTEALGVPGGEWTTRELETWLAEVDASDETIERAVEILEWGHEARFAPVASRDRDELDAMIEQCREIIERLDRRRTDGELGSLGSLAVVGLACAASLLVPSAAEGASPSDFDTRVDRALQAQESGQWSEAARRWSELAAAHPSHAEIRYHYGTAILHDGDVGAGRLALERAVLSNPDLQQAHDNLEVARRIVQHRRIDQARGETTSIPAPPSSLQWWDRAVTLSPRFLGWGLLGGLALALIVLASRYVLDERERQFATIGAALTLAVVLGLGGLWAARGAVIGNTSPAVVTADEATPREGPSEHAAALDATLPVVSGVRVAVREERETWSRVRLSNETTGWIRTDTLVRVVPSSPRVGEWGRATSSR